MWILAASGLAAAALWARQRQPRRDETLAAARPPSETPGATPFGSWGAAERWFLRDIEDESSGPKLRDGAFLPPPKPRRPEFGAAPGAAIAHPAKSEEGVGSGQGPGRRGTRGRSPFAEGTPEHLVQLASGGARGSRESPRVQVNLPQTVTIPEELRGTGQFPRSHRAELFQDPGDVKQAARRAQRELVSINAGNSPSSSWEVTGTGARGLEPGTIVSPPVVARVVGGATAEVPPSSATNNDIDLAALPDIPDDDPFGTSSSSE